MLSSKVNIFIMINYIDQIELKKQSPQHLHITIINKHGTKLNVQVTCEQYCMTHTS